MEEKLRQQVIRFGLFEADLRSGELHKSGLKLKLAGQPFQVLAMLLERPGEMITREEIQKRLWPSDTFVDFEHSVNTAIKKVREVLGDSAESPRFVETLHRRGYRFIAPVERQNGGDSPDRYAGTEQALDELMPRRESAREQREDSGPAPRRRRPWRLAMAGTGVICLAVLAYLLLRPLASPHVSGYVQITNDGLGKGGLVGKGGFVEAIATDGARLYFTDEAAGFNSVLAQVSAGGGETARLFTPFANPLLLDFSPKRSELLLATFAGIETAAQIWALPVPAGTPRRVGEVLASDATWSPNGEEIVYVKNQELYRAKSDGRDARRLLTLPGIASWPRWSRDGDRLRLTVTDNKTGSSAIWDVSANGGAPHRLLPGWSVPSIECCGSWTPDGEYFVFQADHNGKTDIWAIREKRSLLGGGPSEPVQLTSGQMNSLAPVLSPDGKKLYVVGQQLRGELVRYDSKSRQWVPYLAGISAEFVEFSKDGQWMAYVTFPNRTLWRSRIDGSERRQLTIAPTQVMVPRWSPDGKRIVFVDVAPGRPSRMYVIPSDGGKPEPILEEEHNQIDPTWCPDGNSLVFSYWPHFEPESSGVIAVYTVDLRTREVRKLPGSDGLWAPRWSPDGRYIVASTIRPDYQALMLFDLRTQKWAELIKEQNGFTNWSRDGRYVFVLGPRKEPAVVRVRVSDHRVEVGASVKDLRLTGFTGGGYWTGPALDDSPLVLRDVGTREIYALAWH